MTRGCRDGLVTKEELQRRLVAAAPHDTVVPPATAPLPVLLGHAAQHGLVTAKEFTETVPRTERTIPCYLRPRLEGMPAGFDDVLEAYVTVASALFRRGTLLMNLAAQRALGARAAPSGEDAKEYRPPRFSAATARDAARPFADMLFTEDTRNGTFKQFFLPERWPSKKVPRAALVADTLADNLQRVPRLPDWQAVMLISGWDNAINRMATKAHGNVQTHVCAGLVDRVRRYLGVVPIDASTDRELLVRLATKLLQPLDNVGGRVAEADYTMVAELRAAMGVAADDYPQDYGVWSEEAFALHVFLTRHAPRERSYFPVANRGRHYAYVDAVIASAMLKKLKKRTATTTSKPASKGKASKKSEASGSGQAVAEGVGDEADDGGPDPESASSSVCVGDLLGLTPERFKACNKALRRVARQRLRRRARRLGSSKKFKERIKRRQAALRVGKMADGARVDSFETDGVGMRLCVKEPVDISRHVRPLPTAAEAVAQAAAAAAAAATKEAKKRQRVAAAATAKPRAKRTKKTAGASTSQTPPSFVPVPGPHPAPADVQTSTAPPIFVAGDQGRKKLMAWAVSREGTKKPLAHMFTRSRYYKEMGYWSQQSWCKSRSTIPDVQAALAAIAQAGGFKNCNTATWHSTLEVERAHDGALDREYLHNKDYAVWKMRLFRKKRRSMDGAMSRLMQLATQGEHPSRPLVIGVGSAKMAATGRGEMSAPTTALRVALKRAIDRARTRGRAVLFYDVWEHRTTVCCCACGCATRPLTVAMRDRQGVQAVGDNGVGRVRGSRRLRVCTECDPTGKRRDRDVQASRNILWLLQHYYYGAPRPWVMCRQVQ